MVFGMQRSPARATACLFTMLGPGPTMVEEQVGAAHGTLPVGERYRLRPGVGARFFQSLKRRSDLETDMHVPDGPAKGSC